MGAQHSTRSHERAVADAGAGEGDGHAHLPCLAQLMSYEEACRLDPELETFDSTLQQRTSHVISALADGVQVRSLSLDSLRETTGCLLEMNQEVVKVILDCKRDVWKNTELFDLVEDYFENSLQTLDFCTTLEKCLAKARDNQLIIQVALQRFAEEEEEEDNKHDNARYSRTVKELRRFKAAGDPFTEEFFRAFQSIHHQQLQMLDKMQMRKNKLDKKLKSIKAWRKVSSIIFAATLATFLICSAFCCHGSNHSLLMLMPMASIQIDDESSLGERKQLIILKMRAQTWTTDSQRFIAIVIGLHFNKFTELIGQI